MDELGGLVRWSSQMDELGGRVRWTSKVDKSGGRVWWMSQVRLVRLKSYVDESGG